MMVGHRARCADTTGGLSGISQVEMERRVHVSAPIAIPVNATHASGAALTHPDVRRDPDEWPHASSFSVFLIDRVEWHERYMHARSTSRRFPTDGRALSIQATYYDPDPDFFSFFDFYGGE
ncbi:hypothetical protein [Burkholderia gladioli]|uniref:hypothetical protein n=1 Tax=Burkholderia gladioli TaxID=28095 RepID=UPI00163F0725|nr:hypothetical protein [Burkholderia gladioli]